MMKKYTKARLQARIAMAAFAVVGIVTVSSTTIGVLGYVTQVAGNQTSSQTAAIQPTPFGVATIASGPTALSGK
jgi:hypothetical protein